MRRRSYRPYAVISLILLAGFLATDSPYYRAGPGPLIRVGAGSPDAWSVTTVRVRRSTWFRWAVAKVKGEPVVRRGGAGDSGGSGGTSGENSMDASQTHAVLVAAQLAAGRVPTGAAGLQVTDAGSGGLRRGDVLLAAGNGRELGPLRTPDDLAAGASRLLVVPRADDGSWRAAEVRRPPAVGLADLRVSLSVSAAAFRLRPVQGPSAGLVLALARLDDLTPGDLSGGRRVTGTGAIGLDGLVTTVAGIADKVRAARDARADVFFVPYLQRAAAFDAARGSKVRVVPVRSVTDAVGWLCAGAGDMRRSPNRPGAAPGCW